MNCLTYKKIGILTMAMLLLFNPSSLAVEEEQPAVSITRLGGVDRYETGVIIGKTVFENASNVLLVSGENFPDALSGGVFANHIQAPVLLTQKEGIPAVVEAELNRLQAEQTYIIGGPSAIANYQSSAIKNVQVIAGENRYETAQKVALLISDNQQRGYASGRDFPDALSASAMLSKQGIPLELFDGTKAISGEGIVFGGIKVLPDALLGITRRIAGSDRYATSVAVAQEFGDFDTVIIASGTDYPDALAAAPLSKKLNAPILLASPEGLSESVRNLLREHQIAKYVIVGGDKAVSNETELQLEHILDPTPAEPNYNIVQNPIVPGQYRDLVEQALWDYADQGRDYTYGYRDYQPYSYFVECMTTYYYYTEPEVVTFDKLGVPLVNYDGIFYYNPVTIGQFALSAYAEFLNGKRDNSLFLTATDKLISLMDTDGAYRYPFSWTNDHTYQTYEEGWVSCMAQGHALSCYARAYKLTQNPKYLLAGQKTLNFLLTHKNDGGVLTDLGDLSPLLKDKLFFEEYVSSTDTYTLNGYMYTLLGLYDWAILTQDYPSAVGDNQAQHYFDKGMESLCYVIHLYDAGGFTSYDLSHLNYPVDPELFPLHHASHIKLLHNLYSIKPMDRLKEYELLWINYVKDVNKPITSISGFDTYRSMSYPLL